MTGGTFTAGLSDTKGGRGENVHQLLQNARSDKFDYVTTNLPHSSSVQRSDVVHLESKWWSTSVVGIISDPPDFNSTEKDNDDDDVPMNGTDVSSGSPSVSTTPSSSSPPSSSTIITQEYTQGQSLIRGLSSQEKSIRRKAEKILSYMLEFCSHMNIPAIIFPSPNCDTNNNNNDIIIDYARFLSSQALLMSANNILIWIRIPWTRKGLESFNLLSKLCSCCANIGCVVSMDSAICKMEDGRDAMMDVHEYLREKLTLFHLLIGCNVRAISVSTSVFITNKKGFPTLSKLNQMLFTEAMKRIGRTCRVLIEGEPMHHADNRDASGDTGLQSYLQYLRHLRSKEEVSKILDSEESKMETHYLDHLQSALQPLGDNLEFNTYETFEKDPVKYERYREAVELALEDKLHLNQLDGEHPNLNATIVVVGAGRGPLVKASMDAVCNVNETMKDMRIIPRIIAVEKNPSAVMFMNSLKLVEERWSDTVTIVESDMRDLKYHSVFVDMMENGKSVDIVVSELLGSFGDNELSPECLDGVQKSGILSKDCVSIPQDYTSYLAPVSSMRLYSEAQAQAYSPSSSSDGPEGRPSGILSAMETPYVVRSHAASQTHNEKPCWVFNHPVLDTQTNECTPEMVHDIDNERSCKLTFEPDSLHGIGNGPGYGRYDSTLASIIKSNSSTTTKPSSFYIHGFLGTFHSVLYKSERMNKSSVISTAPSSFSTNMFSWFPLYFPLKEPLHVASDASISCQIWRKMDTTKIWYEWCAMTHEGDDMSSHIGASYIHNPNGRSCYVRL